jgi:hypothetical protein
VAGVGGAVQVLPPLCIQLHCLCALKFACCRPGGDSRELWQALAVLYKGQGRPDLSLAVYLQLQLPSVFDFIKVSHMPGGLCSSLLRHVLAPCFNWGGDWTHM